MFSGSNDNISPIKIGNSKDYKLQPRHNLSLLVLQENDYKSTTISGVCASPGTIGIAANILCSFGILKFNAITPDD